jgi:hypothetical protein
MCPQKRVQQFVRATMFYKSGCIVDLFEMCWHGWYGGAENVNLPVAGIALPDWASSAQLCGHRLPPACRLAKSPAASRTV